jgi:hypothetical protein
MKTESVNLNPVSNQWAMKRIRNCWEHSGVRHLKPLSRQPAIILNREIQWPQLINRESVSHFIASARTCPMEIWSPVTILTAPMNGFTLDASASSTSQRAVSGTARSAHSRWEIIMEVEAELDLLLARYKALFRSLVLSQSYHQALSLHNRKWVANRNLYLLSRDYRSI